MFTLPETGGTVSVDKLLRAVKALLEAGERGLTKSQLADCMGASARRAQDAVTILNGQDAVIDSVQTPGRRTLRYILRTTPDWMVHVSRNLQYSAGVAAILMRKVCGPDMALPLDNLRDEAYETMTTRERQEYDRLMARTQLVESLAFGWQLPPPQNPPDRLLQAVLDLFSRDHMPQVRIKYQDPFTGEVSNLLISPWWLVTDIRARETFLLGEDKGRNVPMLLALSHIRNLEPREDLTRDFAPPPTELERLIPQAIQGSLSLHGLVPRGWIQVRLGVRGHEARSLVMGKFGYQAGITADHDFIEFLVPDLEETLSWAIRTGCPEITLLHPPELRELFDTHLRRLWAMLGR